MKDSLEINKYSVIFSDNAIFDLKEISSNYYDNLIGEKIVRYIIEKILNLDILPKRYEIINYEPLLSKQIRKMFVKKYYVYYVVDDFTYTVRVLAIIYIKRNQKSVLEKKHID